MVKQIDNKKAKLMEAQKGVFTVEKQREYVPFQDHEWYPGKFEKHEVGTGNFGDYVKLQFKILGKEMEDGTPALGKTATAMMNAEISPKSKLYEFIQVFNGGEELEIGEKVDITAYYGKKVNVFIADKKSKSDDGKRYQHVEKIKERKPKA